MSIIIRNLGGNMDGTCTYEVRINEVVITTFAHNRPDGLAACLRVAAGAVERKKTNDMMRIAAMAAPIEPPRTAHDDFPATAR